MSNDPRARGALARPLGLFVVGLMFMGVGALRYPGFLGVGIVFMVIGLRGLKHQRAVRVAAEKRSGE